MDLVRIEFRRLWGNFGSFKAGLCYFRGRGESDGDGICAAIKEWLGSIRKEFKIFQARTQGGETGYETTSEYWFACL
jgi:hypothetical protein